MIWSPALDSGRDFREQCLGISLLGINILLHQAAEILAAVHAAAGSLGVHGIFELQGRGKGQGNKLLAFGGLMSGFAGHFVKILFGNIKTS